MNFGFESFSPILPAKTGEAAASLKPVKQARGKQLEKTPKVKRLSSLAEKTMAAPQKKEGRAVIDKSPIVEKRWSAAGKQSSLEDRKPLRQKDAAHMHDHMAKSASQHVRTKKNASSSSSRLPSPLSSPSPSSSLDVSALAAKKMPRVEKRGGAPKTLKGKLISSKVKSDGSAKSLGASKPEKVTKRALKQMSRVKKHADHPLKKAPDSQEARPPSDSMQALAEAEKHFIKDTKGKILTPKEGSDIGGGDRDSDVLFYKTRGGAEIIVKPGIRDAADSVLAREVLDLVGLSDTVPAMKEGYVDQVASAQDGGKKYVLLKNREGEEFVVEKHTLVPMKSGKVASGSHIVYQKSSDSFLAIKKGEKIEVEAAEIYLSEGKHPSRFAAGRSCVYLVEGSEEINEGEIEGGKRMTLTGANGESVVVEAVAQDDDPSCFELVPPEDGEVDSSIDFDQDYYLVKKAPVRGQGLNQKVISREVKGEEEDLFGFFDRERDDEASSLLAQLSQSPDPDDFGFSDDREYLISKKDLQRVEEGSENQSDHWVDEFQGLPFTVLSSDSKRHYLVPEAATSVIKKMNGKKHVFRNDFPYELTHDLKIIGKEVPALFQEKLQHLWVGNKKEIEEAQEGQDLSLDVRKPSEVREEFYAKIDRQSFIDSFVGYMLTRSCDGKIVTLAKESNFLFQETDSGVLKIKQIDLEGVMPPSNAPSDEQEAHPLKCGLMGFPLVEKELSGEDLKYLMSVLGRCVEEKNKTEALKLIAKYDKKLGEATSPELTRQRQRAYKEVIQGMSTFLQTHAEAEAVSLESLFFHVFPSYEKRFTPLIATGMSRQEAALQVGSDGKRASDRL